jgi:hypothetical protein
VPLDFTFAAFDAFCRRIAPLPVFTLAGYLSTAPAPTPPFVILRADVDYRETRALRLAQIAARCQVRGSFYFRHRVQNGDSALAKRIRRDVLRQAPAFNVEIMQSVANLGHEVGYHFETLDTCRGDFDAAEDLFLTNLAHLRAAGVAIRTVAAHGGRPFAPTYRHNFDIFSHAPDLFQRARLLGETTISVDFARVVYVSDARWRWRRYDAYQPGATGKPTSLRAITDALPSLDAGLCINFHPHQWFASPALMLYLRARNRLGRRVFRLSERLEERLIGAGKYITQGNG